MRKIILMLLNQGFPDIRVEQEADALKDAGYRVIIITHYRKTVIKDGYETIPVQTTLNQFEAYLNSLFYGNPYLEKRIIKALATEGIDKVDAVHVHDLFWSHIGYSLKNHFKCKFVIDMHENYPAMLNIFNYERKRNNKRQTIRSWFFNDVLLSYKRLRKYESKMLKLCDDYITVADEYLEATKALVSNNKGIVVSNTKSPKSIAFSDMPKIEDKVIISYVGSIQFLRGLDVVVNAFKLLPEEVYQLNIVGFKKNDPVKLHLEKIIKKNNMSNINLIPWLNTEKEQDEYMRHCHIGIIPHIDCELCQTTMPHKLFSYMAIGRSVLVSDVKPLARIVDGKDCGATFKAGSSADLAKKIQEISNYDTLFRQGKNARALVEGECNWQRDADRLVSMYRSLIGK